MKKILGLILVLLTMGGMAHAQSVIVQPDCSFSATLTGTGRVGGPASNPALGFSNALKGCNSWTIDVTVYGFSAVSYKFDSALDSNGQAGSWSTFGGTVISGSNPSTATDKSSLTVSGFYPWLSFVLSSATGSGQVTISAQGSRDNGGNLSSTLGTPSDSAATAGAGGTVEANLRLMTSQLEAIKVAAEDTTAVAVTPPCASSTPATPIYPGASDNHQTVITGAHVLCSLSAFSIHTAAQFIRVYDAASGFNGCNSATNLKWAGTIPAASTGAGFTGVNFEGGLAFASGISTCITGAIGSTDTTSATASVMTVNFEYK